jgi:hypothetical protein
MMEGLMGGKILSQGLYSVNDRMPPAQLFGKGAPDHRPDTEASLIVTLLLSLGLWAGIWGAITSVLSAL